MSTEQMIIQGTKIEITEELLTKGMSRNGGWSMAQVKLLGYPQGYLNNKGWKKRAIGKLISVEKALEFVALRDKHLKD
jgi:hypothetical protein